MEHDYPNPIASTGFAVIRPAEGISSKFLFFQVLSDSFLRPLHALQSGSSYPAVRARDVFSRSIVLPPTREQERIGAKLDAAFSRLRRADVAANRALERLQRHRAAILQDAVTGELTRTLREAKSSNTGKNNETGSALLRRLLDSRRKRWEEAELKRFRAKSGTPKNDKWKERYAEPKGPQVDSLSKLPAGWAWASIEQLSWASSYGTSAKCVTNAKGPAVLRIPNVRNGTLNFEDLKFARSIQDFGDDDFVTSGDLLLVRTNGSKDLIGRAAIVKKPLKRQYGFASYLIRFRLLGGQTLWSWLSHAWDSELLRTSIEFRAKTTAGQYNVSLSSLADLAIPLPPPDEQAEIVRKVERRLAAADRLASAIAVQLKRSRVARQSLLREAFAGKLVSQDQNDEPASILVGRLRSARGQDEARMRKVTPKTSAQSNLSLGNAMGKTPLTPADMAIAFARTDRKGKADQLFKELGCVPDDVMTFYEVLRRTPEVLGAFKKAMATRPHKQSVLGPATKRHPIQRGRFRLHELWLEEFKNLRNYTATFDATHGLDVVLGWNGTGKSNLFESLVIIFRDLADWRERNRWPDQPMCGYRLRYEIDEQLVEIMWKPGAIKRPLITVAERSAGDKGFGTFKEIDRSRIPMPRFVFGYYSGPTNRLAEHFQSMKQAHYVRLREATSDDPQTLASLLEQRRFFCAETHHAKYVLLAFCYKEDRQISEFLKDRLRIVGFESALFVIRKPRWAKPRTSASDFWGAKGVMRRVLERLREHAIAPMVIEQTVSDGYRTTKEDHYYFFLPDLASLHAFAAEYEDARTFFLALESTDFSELIHDVQIQVRVNTTNSGHISITFREMSEGEQQLLMVLGLIRFTKSLQSLILLDEPDTHLNPHWSVDYLKLLAKVMSEGAVESREQQTSQILVSTHDPLVIASLLKEQVHLMKRDRQSGACIWAPANVNPRGLGFAGILTSDMFGFRSDLDDETLTDLDSKVRLMAKEGELQPDDATKLSDINKRLAEAGFQKAFSDPYYAAFVRAWGRKYSELMAGQRFLSAAQREEIERVADEILVESKAEVEREATR